MGRLARLKRKSGPRGMRRCHTCGQLYTAHAMLCPACTRGHSSQTAVMRVDWLAEAAKTTDGLQLVREWSALRAMPDYKSTPKYAYLCALAAQLSGLFTEVTPQMLSTAKRYWEGGAAQ